MPSSFPIQLPVDSFVMLSYNWKVSAVIQRDPEILSGIPTFKGTRVPVKNLFDYLEAGNSLDEFIDDFPAVTKDQVLELLSELREAATKKRDVA